MSSASGLWGLHGRCSSSPPGSLLGKRGQLLSFNVPQGALTSCFQAHAMGAQSFLGGQSLGEAWGMPPFTIENNSPWKGRGHAGTR